MAFINRNPYQQYKQAEVDSMSQGELIIMLYNGAIRFLEEAMHLAGDFKNYDEVNTKLIKTQDIVTELMVSLNMDNGGEVAQNLLSIYVYIKRRLIEANMNKDRRMMEEPLRHLKSLRDAWMQVAQKEEKSQAPGAGSQGGISFRG